MSTFHVSLHRSSITQPWGFRIEGFVIDKKVFQGSPASADLQRGDSIISIQQRDASSLFHQEALELIERAGGVLELQIKRIQQFDGGQSFWESEQPSFQQQLQKYSNIDNNNNTYSSSFNFSPSRHNYNNLSNYQQVGKYVSHLNNNHHLGPLFDNQDQVGGLVRNRVIEKPRDPRPYLSQTGGPILPYSSTTLPRNFSSSRRHVSNTYNFTKPVPIIDTVQPMRKYEEKQLVDRLHDSLQRAVSGRPRPISHFDAAPAPTYYDDSINAALDDDAYFASSSLQQRGQQQQQKRNSIQHYGSYQHLNYLPSYRAPWVYNKSYKSSGGHQHHQMRPQQQHYQPQQQQPSPKFVYSKHEASDYSSGPSQPLQVVNKQYNTPIGLYSNSTLNEELHKQISSPYAGLNALPSSDF